MTRLIAPGVPLCALAVGTSRRIAAFWGILAVFTVTGSNARYHLAGLD